jgi:hydrogenase expression/formation protein HypC
MCLAIPALVKSIDGAMAVAEVGGVERSVSVMLIPDVQVGDYVLIHTGFAISVIDEQEAQETLRLFAELAEFYPEDLGLTEEDGRSV